MSQERRFVKIGERDGWTLEVEELIDEERVRLARHISKALREEEERLLQEYLEGRLDLGQFARMKESLDRDMRELERAPGQTNVVKSVVGHPGALVWIITTQDYEEFYNLKKPQVAVLNLIREINVIRHNTEGGTVRIKWWIPAAE